MDDIGAMKVMTKTAITTKSLRVNGRTKSYVSKNITPLSTDKTNRCIKGELSLVW